MGKLIVVEGLDGSGKSTQTKLIYSNMQEHNINCRAVKFPQYGKPSAAAVEQYLSGELGELSQISPYGASTFYTVDRYSSYLSDWGKDYNDNCTILCDRYTTSNIAHQMSKLPPSEWDSYLEWICDLEYNKIGLPAPDIVVYLDVEPVVSAKLIAQRGQDSSKRDIHEENLQYLIQCRKAALYGAEKLGWEIIHCTDGDSILPIETIQSLIQEKLSELYTGERTN